MSLQEAREVKWLRSKPRPIGELLEEGYLNADRLKWAAKNAYVPKLKEAAQVMLDWESSGALRTLQQPQTTTRPSASPPKSFPLAMSLEEARSTKWPFGPLRGQPMGELSDTRQITIKDLGYLIDNDWDERVRQAAIAVLLVRLDQELSEPPPLAGPLRVIASGRTFGQRRQLALTLFEGTILGGALASGLWLLIGSVTRQSSAHPAITLSTIVASPSGIVALLMVAILCVGIVWLPLFLMDRVINRLDKEIENYQRGQEGEDKVVEKARQALDGNWVLFRNIVLPGRRRADLDVVLVGPLGAWAVEVKSLRGKYRNMGEGWAFWGRGRWRRMLKNPSRQARVGAILLSEFLKADGIKTYVSAAIAWANPESQLAIEDPTVAVWTIDRLEDELGNLGNGERLPAPVQERIVEKLTRLCVAPRKSPR
jgi:hypothetical protein